MFRDRFVTTDDGNPPSPPFSKGGMGGFEGYFLGNQENLYQFPELSFNFIDRRDSFLFNIDRPN